jgi:hypothetical protein
MSRQNSKTMHEGWDLGWNPVQSAALLPTALGLVLALFFDLEDGGDIFLRNVGRCSTNYMMLHRRIWPCHSSGRLPTATTRVRAQVRSYGICGGQSGTGAGFLRVFRFPHANSYSNNCSIFIIIYQWVADLRSGLTQPHKINKIIHLCENLKSCKTMNRPRSAKPPIQTPLWRWVPAFRAYQIRVWLQSLNECVWIGRPLVNVET